MAEPTHYVRVGADFKISPLDNPGDGTLVRITDDITIPPDYGTADTEAMIARALEDNAYALNLREFGRRPGKDALRAATARLIALRDMFSRMPRSGAFAPHAALISHLLSATNAQIIAEWGEEEPDA